jgi:NAD(P)-dependent dehydrogenase (short-subunit alcohol dehydrogenase family)
MDPGLEADWGEGAALVVGGSGAIGRSICLALARAGANIALTYRTKELAAAETAGHIRTCGRSSEVYRLGLEDADAVRATVTQAISRFGHLHSVVYASGPSLNMKLIADLQPSEWARVVDGDVKGCFNLIAATLPHFRERKAGTFVSVITAAVHRVPPRDILSAAPKAALEMLMRGVAKEEGRNNIRANCVGPGWIDAGLGRQVMQHELSDDQIERIRRAIPLKRFGHADEIAEAVLFLLSARARYITGQTIAVDGGLQL